MQRSKLRKLALKVGKCYEESGGLVCKEPEAILVHGEVWSGVLKQFIDHAWVELPIGTEVSDAFGDSEVLKCVAIVDLTLKKKLRLMPKDVYLALAKAREQVRYTHQEALEMTLNFQHWGPWHLGGKDGTGSDV